MLLEGKTAVIYGAGGAIGGAVARAFAREGARVHLTGRTLGTVQAVADQIAAAGGTADAARVDALDEGVVEAYTRAVAEKAGGIDVSFNAVGIRQDDVQGTPILDLAPEQFTLPVHTYTTAHFLTARAAARSMVARGSGVILTITATSARMAGQLVGGIGPAWAAMEAFSRGLAAELGPRGVRVVCLRSHGMPETPVVQEVIGLHARASGMTSHQMQSLWEDQTMLGRLPTLAEVANTAAFLASDRASAMTASVVNLTCGAIAD
jgi:NAD(P)-dependent dehydrogenase (short-subunit alcohol dehydrogenase family)